MDTSSIRRVAARRAKLIRAQDTPPGWWNAVQYVALAVFAVVFILALRSGPDPAPTPPDLGDVGAGAAVGADGFDDDFFGSSSPRAAALADEQLLVALDALAAQTGLALADIGSPAEVVRESDGALRARFALDDFELWVRIEESDGRWVAQVER
jgi:hypothetical protein